MVRGYSRVVTLQGEKCQSKVHWVGNCAVGWVCAWWFKAWIIRRGDPSSRNAILSKTERKRFSMESNWQHWCGFSMVFLENGIQHVLKKGYRASVGSHVELYRWPTFALSLASANFDVAKKFRLLKLTLSWALTSSHAYSIIFIWALNCLTACHSWRIDPFFDCVVGRSW